MALGRALHSAGVPAHQQEETLDQVARGLHLEAQFLATPTGLVATLEQGPGAFTRMARLPPGETDLGRLAALDLLTHQAAQGRLSPGGLRAALRKLPSSSPSSRSRLLAHGGISAGAAVLLGGGAADLALASVLGLLVGWIERGLVRRPSGPPLFELLAAAAAALGAPLLAPLLPGASPGILRVAALIALVPGFALTLGMRELAARHPVSGAARLVAALFTFLQIAVGVSLGEALLGQSPLSTSGSSSPGAPGLGLLLMAWVLCSLALRVLFRAAPRDQGLVAVGCGLALLASRLGTALLGPGLGTWLAAVMVGCLANLSTHHRSGPAATLAAPALMMLVPGSLGFRSLETFLRGEILGGTEVAFAMLFGGAAIATGTLVAQGLVTPRRPL